TTNALCNVRDDSEPLVVDVEWDLTETASYVGGTCTEAGVDDYDYELFDANGNVVASDFEVTCLAGALRLDFGTLPAGDYLLEGTGYENDGIAYWFADCDVSPDSSMTWLCQAYDDP